MEVGWGGEGGMVGNTGLLASHLSPTLPDTTGPQKLFWRQNNIVFMILSVPQTCQFHRQFLYVCYSLPVDDVYKTALATTGLVKLCKIKKWYFSCLYSPTVTTQMSLLSIPIHSGDAKGLFFYRL